MYPRTNLIGWSGPGVVPQRKTVDELRGDGDGAETYARLVLEDNLYYNPEDYDFLEANASVGQKQGDAPLSVNFSAEPQWEALILTHGFLVMEIRHIPKILHILLVIRGITRQS